MTEQLKFIINQLNNEVHTNYDLIKFDSLNEAQHLQILVDLLVHYEAGEKMIISEEDPESVSVKLLDMLRNVKYKPDDGINLTNFRRNLITGERSTIFAILQWLLKNKEQAKKTAYLAKYLIRPDIPSDILGNADMVELLEMHDKLMEEFKEAHKNSLSVHQSNSSEIISDLKEMGIERDLIIKRLEVAQQNLSEISNKEHVLGVAKEYRLQEEKSKELLKQIAEQEEKLKKASEHLQRNLGYFRNQSSIPQKSEELIQRMIEEIKVNEYLVNEKNPSEITALQQDVDMLLEVQNLDNTNRDTLLKIQEKIELTNREVDMIIQKKMAASDPQDDKLAPFRNQAAIIKRNKQVTGEKLEELKRVLHEIKTKLAEKQTLVHQNLGDTILRGDDLKKYVNKLRTKSSVYKRQRGLLSALKGKTGVLTRTLEILQSRDPTLELALLNHQKLNISDELSMNDDTNPETLSKKSTDELIQMVSQTNQMISEIKHEISPLVNRIKPLKDEYQQLQQIFEQKKRVHDSTSINMASQIEPLENELKDLEKKLDTKENEWKSLKQQIEKAENLLKIIDEESKIRSGNISSTKKLSKMETLQNQINQQEKQAAILKEEQKFVSERQSMLTEQTVIWSNLLELLECKKKCIEDAKQNEGSITITKQAETLTL